MYVTLSPPAGLFHCEGWEVGGAGSEKGGGGWVWGINSRRGEGYW